MNEANETSQDQRKIKRVDLDGDALVFRVFENGTYKDRVFIRDISQPRGNNCWTEVANYRTFVETYETTSYCPECGKKWLDHNHDADDPCA